MPNQNIELDNYSEIINRVLDMRVIVVVVLLFFLYFLWKIFFTENREQNEKYIIAVFEIIIMLVGLLFRNQINAFYFWGFGVIILLSLKKDWFLKFFGLGAWAGDGAAKFMESTTKEKNSIKQQAQDVSNEELIPQ